MKMLFRQLLLYLIIFLLQENSEGANTTNSTILQIAENISKLPIPLTQQQEKDLILNSQTQACQDLSKPCFTNGVCLKDGTCSCYKDYIGFYCNRTHPAVFKFKGTLENVSPTKPKSSDNWFEYIDNIDLYTWLLYSLICFGTIFIGFMCCIWCRYYYKNDIMRYQLRKKLAKDRKEGINSGIKKSQLGNLYLEGIVGGMQRSKITREGHDKYNVKCSKHPAISKIVKPYASPFKKTKQHKEDTSPFGLKSVIASKNESNNKRKTIFAKKSNFGSSQQKSQFLSPSSMRQSNNPQIRMANSQMFSPNSQKFNNSQDNSVQLVNTQYLSPVNPFQAKSQMQQSHMQASNNLMIPTQSKILNPLNLPQSSISSKPRKQIFNHNRRMNKTAANPLAISNILSQNIQLQAMYGMTNQNIANQMMNSSTSTIQQQSNFNQQI